MRITGIIFALAGWVVSVAGLFITQSVGGRGLIACVGIAISLTGSLGFINKYYLNRAIWRK